MRAVWSFWSKPYLAYRDKTWPSERHHLYSWALSFECARRHYPDTALVTDRAGAAILCDDLGLDFGSVSLDLEELADVDAGWWAAGKLLAYARQDRPFVHIDSDVYLWKPLPEGVAGARVFAQNPEAISIGYSFYDPEGLENALGKVEGTWLPEAWTWYRAQGREQYAPCCGIVGGTDVEFIREYASNALRMIQEPANRRALESFGEKASQMILVEQYLLAACCEFRGIRMENLFASVYAAFDSSEAAAKGFTHLLADAKNNPVIAKRLEARVRLDYPGRYRRCAQIQ